MSNVEKLPPTELDLHAFLDDELDPGERIRVIEWLLDHPEKSQELLQIQLREDLLRSAVHQSVNGELPTELSNLTFKENTQSPRELSRDFLYGALAGAFSVIVLVCLALLIF